MTSLARDNTMVATAKEGIAFLQKEGAEDLIKLQGIDGAHNGNGHANGNGNGDTHEANGHKNGDSTNESAAEKTETDVPSLPQHRTIVETTKEAEHVLNGETFAETRASTEQLKNAVVSSSPPQKSRTMVETAKIGQALLGAEAPLIGETRKQTADTKKAEEEAATEAAPAVEHKNGENGNHASEAEPEAEKAVEAEVEGEAESGSKKKAKTPSPKKATPKKTPVAKKAKKEEKAEAETETEKESPVAVEEKAAKSASPKKRGGRPSMVDQLVQEAQKFAGNAAGDVSERRTTRRSSKGAEAAPATPSPPPAKRGRVSKGKGKAAAADEDDE